MEDDSMMPEIPLSRGDDIHNLEHVDDADLLLFVAGNQFMVMGELLEEFSGRHPDIGRIFYETLPPGLELRQILAGGARFGDTVLTGRPDVYTSVSEEAMLRLKRRGLIDEYSVYLHNRLVLMVPEGNPKGISGVQDLGRDDLRVSQPGEMEDIAKHTFDMYTDAGGYALLNRIMTEKLANGTTTLTLVHHRETPQRILDGQADVGPVWATEVVHARTKGLRIEAVQPGPDLDQHDRVNYFMARLTEARNPEHAALFLDFLRSGVAQQIFGGYGFSTHFPA